MNQTIESNTQALKLDTFKNIKKIGLKEILKSQKSISKTVSTIDKILREKDENGKVQEDHLCNDCIIERAQNKQANYREAFD